MVNLGTRTQVYGIATIMLIGVVGEAVVLFFVDDAVLRLRAGMLLLAVIAWPLYYAARRFPAGDAVLAEHPRRRFGRLRRWTRELLREISRLNWTVVDVSRGFRDREASKEEIAAIETRTWPKRRRLTGGGQRHGAGTEYQHRHCQRQNQQTEQRITAAQPHRQGRPDRAEQAETDCAG